MLHFVTQLRNIKVLRITSDQDGVHRERIGTIPKKDYSLSDEFSGLPPEELAQVQAMIAFCKKAPQDRLRAQVSEFPDLAREVVTYVLEEGTDFERQVILANLLEGIRRIRSADRDKENDI